MNNLDLKSQLADYLSSCAFEPFTVLTVPIQLRAFTIRVPRTFSKPILELSQALSEGSVEVTEVDQGGSVQELLVHNPTESYLLIYEGSLLKGAKQNRVINATLLLPPRSKQVIPASCVEQGRWRYASPGFTSSPYSSPQFLRKSIRTQIHKRSNLMGSQGQVWEDIRRYAALKKTHSDSGDFEDIYHRSNKTEQLFPNGLSLPPTEGFLVETRGECTMDLVANKEAFAHLLPRLVAGFELPHRDEHPLNWEKPTEEVARWLAEGEVFTQPSPGVGIDIRIRTDQHLMSALMVDEEVVAFGLTAHGA
jgi:hypothetical protein